MNLTKNDDDIIINLAKNFIEFYYSNLNNKKYDLLLPYLKEYTVLNCQKNKYKGNNLINYFNYLENINAIFSEIDFETSISGARRINILVTGKLNYNENEINIIKNFAEYIHCGTDSNKNFWIQTIIFKLI